MGTFHAATTGELDTWFNTYIPRTERLDPMFSPTGVAFSCSLDDQGRGSLLVERSLVIPKGVFVRTTCEYPGAISERVVCDRGMDFLSAALDKFGMVVGGDDNEGTT